MNDILQNIEEYKAGCADIRRRIEQLNRQIAQERREGKSPQKLTLDRRYILYEELADMLYAMESLQEYADLTGLHMKKAV